MIFLADVNFTSSPQSPVGRVDDEVQLSCEATGQSVKVIGWTVGDKKVLSSDAVYNISSKQTANGRRSTLTIKQLKLSHGSLESFCTAGTTMYPDLQASNVATIHGVLPVKRILCFVFLFIVLSIQFWVILLVSMTRPTVLEKRHKNLSAVCLLPIQSQMLPCSL